MAATLTLDKITVVPQPGETLFVNVTLQYHKSSNPSEQLFYTSEGQDESSVDDVYLEISLSEGETWN